MKPKFKKGDYIKCNGIPHSHFVKNKIYLIQNIDIFGYIVIGDIHYNSIYYGPFFEVINRKLKLERILNDIWYDNQS